MFFFFKQKTAYEMRISDWSSDVCSSDLTQTLLWRPWPARDPNFTVNARGETACRVYRMVPARALWDLVMRSTYAYSDPGFILIDECNRSEERRVGKECVSTCRSRWSP